MIACAANAETDCPRSLLFVVGIILSLSESFGFFVVFQLFSQCWDLFGDWTCGLQSMEVLWVDVVQSQVLVCFRHCCQFGQSFVDS